MNSRVGRLGGHSHDARNLTFLFRSREATTHRVYLNEVDTKQQRYRMVRFGVAIFLSAFLLFQVQPLMGKYILPWFGGGPAVWTICLLFFQVFC